MVRSVLHILSVVVPGLFIKERWIKRDFESESERMFLFIIS